MFSRSFLALLAFASFVAFVAATVNEADLVNFDSSEDVQQRRNPRLLNLPALVRPFCTKIVGTVQSAPQVCNKVSDFVVDATLSACKESFREICKQIVGARFACDAIIKKICPNRPEVAKKIKPSVDKHCKKSLQPMINKFGHVASNVDKNALCDSFVSGVRQTCHFTINDYCTRFDSQWFRYPCETFLPNIVCE